MPIEADCTVINIYDCRRFLFAYLINILIEAIHIQPTLNRGLTTDSCTTCRYNDNFIAGIVNLS